MGSQVKETKNYYSIREHNIVKNVKEKTATSFENKQGDKTFHFEKIAFLNGFLKRLLIWTNQNNDKSKEWEVLSIFLEDSEGVQEVLEMYFSGSGTDSFLNRLANVDLTQEVKIKCFRKDGKEGKSYDMVCIYQGEENGKDKLVANYWIKGREATADKEAIAPSEYQLPEWKEVEIKGKKAMDNSDLLKFWRGFCDVKNAEMADIIKAQSKGITNEQIRENTFAAEFGRVFNYSKELQEGAVNAPDRENMGATSQEDTATTTKVSKKKKS